MFRLPSFLYRQRKNSRHSGPGRKIPQKAGKTQKDKKGLTARSKFIVLAFQPLRMSGKVQ